MTVSFVASTTGSRPGNGNTTVNTPAGVVNGDYMLAVLSSDLSQVTPTPPAGWTLLLSQSGLSLRLFVFGRVASSEPGSNVWATADSIAIVHSAWHSTLGPMTLGTQGSYVNWPGTSSITLPSLSLSQAGRLVIVGAYDTNNGTNNSWVAPGGMTLQTQFKGPGRPCLGVFDQDASAGATGSRAPTWTGISSGTTALMLSLNEPGPKNASLFFGSNF